MPYLPKDRQYRDFAVTNFAPVIKSDDSDDDDEKSYKVRGYFCTFNEPYELFKGYWEEIGEHAFDETDMSDVIFQVNHDGHVYARNRNGSLTISVDGHGGISDADLVGSKQGRENLYESIKNGLVDRMSFGFAIAEGGFEYTVDGDGVYHTRITKIAKLYDVSAIEGFPANDGTEISARSLQKSVMDAIAKRAAIDVEEPTEEPAEEPTDEQAEEESAETVEEAVEEQPEDEQLRARQRRMRRARAMRLSSL